MTKIIEEREQRLGKRKKVRQEVQKERTWLFLSSCCQNFKTAQQTCAIVAVVHGNALELILLGGPTKWKLLLHEDKSKSMLLPSNFARRQDDIWRNYCWRGAMTGGSNLQSWAALSPAHRFRFSLFLSLWWVPVRTKSSLFQLDKVQSSQERSLKRNT